MNISLTITISKHKGLKGNQNNRIRNWDQSIYTHVLVTRDRGGNKAYDCRAEGAEGGEKNARRGEERKLGFWRRRQVPWQDASWTPWPFRLCSSTLISIRVSQYSRTVCSLQFAKRTFSPPSPTVFLLLLLLIPFFFFFFIWVLLGAWLGGVNVFFGRARCVAVTGEWKLTSTVSCRNTNRVYRTNIINGLKN